MGSVYNYSCLSKYVNIYGEEDKKHYEELLLGKKIIKFSDSYVEYCIKSDIVLDDGQEYETHFRWASAEEDSTNIETPDNGDVPLSEYYNEFILDKEITKIEINFDRDDYIYCFAYTGKPEDNHYIEIPIIAIEDINEKGEIVYD